MSNTMTTENVHINLDDMFNFISGNINNNIKFKYSAKPGKSCLQINDNDSALYCFPDYDGNILKAASWLKPAKDIREDIRGTAFDHNFLKF